MKFTPELRDSPLQGSRGFGEVCMVWPGLALAFHFAQALLHVRSHDGSMGMCGVTQSLSYLSRMLKRGDKLKRETTVLDTSACPRIFQSELNICSDSIMIGNGIGDMYLRKRLRTDALRPPSARHANKIKATPAASSLLCISGSVPTMALGKGGKQPAPSSYYEAVCICTGIILGLSAVTTNMLRLDLVQGAVPIACHNSTVCPSETKGQL